MRVQITHLKAPWPHGAVVGDVLDLPAVPVWAVGKCKQVEDDAELTIVDNSDYVAPATEGGDGVGEALPRIDPLPVIDDEPAKAKGKHK